MKQAMLLVSILSLAACGGGSVGNGDIGGITNIPEIPSTMDFTITSMSDTADNSVEINTYVENILGTDFDSGASGASVISRHAAIRSGTTHAINNADTDRNARNQQQIEDMYAFYTKSDAEKREFISKNRRLVKRYAQLAYGDKIEDFDFDNSEIDAILEYLSHDKFKWNNVYDKYKFQKHNLADQTLYASGSRENDGLVDDYVKITQTNNGKITKIKLRDRWFGSDNDMNFARTKNGQFLATEYSYYYRCGVMCQLKYDTDNPKESLANIKAGLLASLDKTAQYDQNIDKESITQQIIGITDISEFVSKSDTEMDAWYDKDIHGFYSVPNEFMLDVLAYGADVGLRYSDFGKLSGIQYLKGNKADAEKLSYAFAGGYDIKNIDKDTMSGEMVYTGRAVGHVMHHTEDADGVATNNYLDIASDAKLVFADGTETLTMNFSDNANANNRWYDVEFAKDGDNITVSLTNGDKITEANSQYKFNQTEYSGQNNQQDFTYDNGNGWGNSQMAAIETSYYGDNGKPEEVVGRALLSNQDWDNSSAITDERVFTASFGATLDKK